MNIYEFAYTVPGQEDIPQIKLGMIRAESKAEAQTFLHNNHDYIDVHVVRFYRSREDFGYPSTDAGHKLFRQEAENPYV